MKSKKLLMVAIVAGILALSASAQAFVNVKFDFEPQGSVFTAEGYIQMNAQKALAAGNTYDGTHRYGMNTGYSVNYGGTNHHWNYDYPSWTVGETTYYEADLRLRDGSNLYGDMFKVEVPSGDYYVTVVGGLAGIDNDSERFLINGTYYGCDHEAAGAPPLPYTYFWDSQVIPDNHQHTYSSYFNINIPGDSPAKGYKGYLHARMAPVTVTDGLIQITNNAHEWASGVNFVEIVSAEPANCLDVWAGEYGIEEDLNHDCYVNLADLAMFASNWLRCNDPADTNCEENW